MDFLKDKKNLPIVIGIAVAVLVAMGGVIAFELGLFSGGGSSAPPPPKIAGGLPGAGPSAPSPMGGPPPGGPPGMMMPAAAPGGPSRPGAKTAAAPAQPAVMDPTKGPDPFNIPGGIKRIASIDGANGKGLKGMKAPLRDILPPFNLFKIQPPAPPPLPPGPTGPGVSGPPPNIRVEGIVNGTDGISAILEVNGQSQTVKPGDSLLDGSRVTAIQSTGVTIVSASGGTNTLPLTGGTGQGDQTGNVADPNAGGPQFGQP